MSGSELVCPICPVCRKTMSVQRYKGYYESFTYWACACSDEDLHPFLEFTWKGEWG